MGQKNAAWKMEVWIALGMVAFHMCLTVFFSPPRSVSVAAHIGLALAVLSFFVFPDAWRMARLGGSAAGICAATVLGMCSYPSYAQPAMLLAAESVIVSLALLFAWKCVGRAFAMVVAAMAGCALLSGAVWSGAATIKATDAPCFSHYDIMSPLGTYGVLTFLSSDVVFLLVVFASFLGALEEQGDNAERGGGAALCYRVLAASVMLGGEATCQKRFARRAHASGARWESACAAESAVDHLGALLPPVLGVAALVAFFASNVLPVVFFKYSVLAVLANLAVVSVSMALAARKNGAPSLLPPPGFFNDSLANAIIFLAPLGVFVCLVALGASLAKGVAGAIVAACLAMWLHKRAQGKNVCWAVIGRALAQGGVAGSRMAVVLILAGFLAVCVKLCGIPEAAAHAAVLCAGSEYALVGLSAVLFLGVGCFLPSPAAYVLGVTLGGPVLENIALTPFQLHLFILFCVVYGNILTSFTPYDAAPNGAVRGSRIRGFMERIKIVTPFLPVLFFLFYTPAFVLPATLIFSAAGAMSFALAVAVNRFFVARMSLYSLGLLVGAISCLAMSLYNAAIADNFGRGALLFAIGAGHVIGALTTNARQARKEKQALSR